jgi:ABC-type uncharacterized transport system substrate-binding protein
LPQHHSIFFPIVFTQVWDPVGGGFVASLAQPGGNITGFSLGEFSLGGKILEVLKEVAPQVSRVAVILNIEQPTHVAMWRTIQAMAASFGVRVAATDVQKACMSLLLALRGQTNRVHVCRLLGQQRTKGHPGTD